MITCNVLGPSEIDGHYLAGLGNQMFTVATTIALALDNNDEAVFPDIKRRDWYGNYIDNIFRNLKVDVDKSFVRCMFQESSWNYKEIPYSPDLCLNGYFQSEKYFKHRRKEILETFKVPDDMLFYLNKEYKEILQKDNTVAVHIRRGDYLTPRLSQYHYAQKPDYYERAMDSFGDDFHFVFFSDDIDWCKETFSRKGIYFVEGEEDVVDLYLMSMMKHNIIANSTFSWWGAWMNQNPNKRVIAPKKWYGPKNSHKEYNHDLISSDWEVL